MENDELRHHDDLVGNHHGHEHASIPEGATAERNPGKAVGHQGGGEHRSDGGKYGVVERIVEEGGERHRVVELPSPDVVVKPEGFRDEGAGVEYFCIVLEGV